MTRYAAPNYARFRRLKADWVARNPNSTEADYNAAVRRFALRCGV